MILTRPCLFLLFALALCTHAVQDIHRAKLCASGSVCTYESEADFTFSQSGTDKEPETSNVHTTFTLTAVCEHEDSTTFKMAISRVVTDKASSGISDAAKLAKFPIYVTQSHADGSLSDFVSPESETEAFADFKRGLLDIVSYPAAKEVLSGSLSEDLEYSFDYTDMHGPHTVKQTAHKHTAGISLISTRVYQKASEIPSLEADAEADENDQVLLTTQSGTTNAELAPGGETKAVKNEEDVKVLGPTAEEQGPTGDYTETLEGTGESEMTFHIDAKLVSVAKAEAACPEGSPAETFLQTAAGPNAQRVAPYAPARPRAPAPAPAFRAADLKAAKQLLAGGGDFTSEVLRLSKLLEADGAATLVAEAGLAQYRASEDPLVFEKLAAALAASGRADGLGLAAGLAADDRFPAQLRVKALVALLAARKAEESVLRTVEDLAGRPYAPADNGLPGDDDVPSAARLVLGGLLHKHRKSPSGYVQGLVAAMEAGLSGGKLPAEERGAYASALGNAAFPSSAAAVAPLAADTEPREVRLAALHALRRFPYDGRVEAALVGAARANDTSVSGEAVRLLQERTGSVFSLEDLQAKADGCAPFCPPVREGFGDAALKNSITITFIEAIQELSKSDVHFVKLTEGLYYKYGYDSSKSEHVHKIEGSATLKAGVYSVSWDFLKVGIYAEKKTGEKSGIYFFVDIMNVNVIKKTLAGGEPAVKDLQIGSDIETDLDELLEVQEKGATCSGAWATGIAGDFGYSRQLFKMSKSFWVYIIMLDVSFSGTGRVGLKPGLSVKSCTNSRTGGNEVMVMGGMEPYASVTINLECSINLLLVRGGVGGELKVIDIGFPLYGEKYWSSGDLCGYLDFRYEACSGRLYLFADHISCSWFLNCGWKRWGELNIVTWTGWKGTKNILQACSPGGNGFNTVSSGVKNAGVDCWGGCGAKQGACAWCGTGYCCRKGWHDKSNGCDGNMGISGKGHVCVNAPVKNAGVDCWGGCHAKQGSCAWCGSGYCCRKGWHDKSNGCDGNMGISGKGHVCVAAP